MRCTAATARWVSDLRHSNPLSHVFIEAANQAGIASNRDFNGPAQAGGPVPGHPARWRALPSAAAYLAPVRSRSNLTVHTGAWSAASPSTDDARMA